MHMTNIATSLRDGNYQGTASGDTAKVMTVGKDTYALLRLPLYIKGIDVPIKVTVFEGKATVRQ